MRASLTLVLLVLPSIAIAETLMGRADTLRDGDTIVVSGVPIRLQGLAAPELRTARVEPCGAGFNPPSGPGRYG